METAARTFRRICEEAQTAPFFLVAMAVALMEIQCWRPSITCTMEKWERQQVFIFKQWRQQNGRLSFSIAVEKSKTIIIVIDTKLRKNTKIVNSYYSLASRSPTTPIDPILEGELKIKEKTL
jgi:hypothetical protein